MSIKHQIPMALILSRLVTGIVLVVLSFLAPPYFNWIAIILISYGLLSDIFDGIIARQLNISNEKLRRLDFILKFRIYHILPIPHYIHLHILKNLSH